MKANTIRRQAG